MARRLAGEGEAEDLIGAYRPLVDEMGNAHRHRRGFSRAGTCHDEQGCERVVDDAFLLGRRGELLTEFTGERGYGAGFGDAVRQRGFLPPARGRIV